jgi:hypothetical protein
MTAASNIWEANTVRFVLFPTEPVSLSTDLWGAIFHSEPDSEEKRPREGIKRQLGRVSNAQATVSITPSLIEVVMTPPPPEPHPNGIPIPLVIIGKFSDVLDEFAEKIRAWLPTNTIPASRVSITGIALAEVQTVEDAYGILASRLKSVAVQPGAMRDFIFRVNWRKPTDTGQLGYYNRLTTWSALTAMLAVGTAGTAHMMNVSQQHYAQLELDINTPADRTAPLESKDLAAIFDDMVALAYENLEKGECA